jgi:hypothetical protein
MDSTKSYIIGMVISVLSQIQHKDYQLYVPCDIERYEEHKVSARANMDAVPVGFKDQLWVKNHELAMALVTEIRNRFSGGSELHLFGMLPHFDLWVSDDYSECRLTILTFKQQ